MVPPSHPAPAIPGDDAPVLGDGRYRLATTLGSGGTAVVYRAWDTQDQQWRAVKVLLPEFGRHPKVRKRFANEGQTMLNLAHRHVIQVYEVNAESERPYIVMELAEGGCVFDWVQRNGIMPARMAVDVLMQVSKGLATVHAQGGIHRDVKPHNILVTRRGVCRIGDFGIAQLDGFGGLTRTGSTMGTLGYMSPEQCADSKHVTTQADIYGLGATLFALTTQGPVESLFRATHDPTVYQDMPEAFHDIFIKAVAYRPSDRYDSVNVFSKALQRVKRSLPNTPADTPPLARPPGRESPLDWSRTATADDTYNTTPDFADLRAPDDVPDRRP